MDYENCDSDDAKLLRAIASGLEIEWQMGGLSDGLYFKWAAEVAVLFHAAKVRDNTSLTGGRAATENHDE